MFQPWRSWARHFPELERFADDARAASALRKAQAEVPIVWRAFRGVLAVAAMAVVMALLQYWASRTFPSNRWLTGGIWVLRTFALFTPVVATGWFLTHLYRRAVRRSLRFQLNAVGKPTCMKCGYNLTGNISGICPECGTACPAAASARRTQA